MRASSWMPWNRRFTNAGQTAAASSITAIAAASTCRSSTRSASPRPASSRRSAVWATAMTTPWPRPSTASTRPRSSIGGGRGDPSKPSNTRHWNGSTGSTTSGCSSPSGTCRQPKQKSDTTRCWTKLPSPHNSIQTASGNPGAVPAEVLVDRREEGIGVVISGPITRETGFQFVRAIADVPLSLWNEMVYVLNSPGGSPKVATNIAGSIRETSSFVMVLSGSECSSACFILLAAAKIKIIAPDALISVHSAQTKGAGEDWDALAMTAAVAKIVAGYGIPDAL